MLGDCMTCMVMYGSGAKIIGMAITMGLLLMEIPGYHRQAPTVLDGAVPGKTIVQTHDVHTATTIIPRAGAATLDFVALELLSSCSLGFWLL